MGTSHGQGHPSNWKCACKMATHNWNVNYHELLSLMDISTLERRRLELKPGHLFHQGIIKFREQASILSNIYMFCSFFTPLSTTSSYKLILLFITPYTTSLWNSLPYELVSASSFDVFKSKLQSHTLCWISYWFINVLHCSYHTT